MRRLLSLFILGLPVLVQGAELEPHISQMTAYESLHVEQACLSEGCTVTVPSVGEPIRFIRIHRFPVFVDFEAFYTFPNAIRIMTRPEVIRREIIPKVGDVWDHDLVSETRRNLQGLSIFSVVALAPVKDSKTQEFGLLVVTRDLWSLRLEGNFQFTGGHVDRISTQLAERNLAGLGKQTALRFGLERYTMNTGMFYLDPNLLGRRYLLSVSGDALFRRETKAYDGFTTTVQFSRPLYRLSQPNGFSTWLSWTQGRGQEPTAYDDPETSDVESIPRLWRYDIASTGLNWTWQRGRTFILRYTLGAGASWVQRETVEESGLEQYPSETRERFIRDVLPDERQWVYPVMRLYGFSNRYHRFRNLAGFALSEDVRLGWMFYGNLSVPTEFLGSSADLLRGDVSASWTEVYAGSGLVEVAGGIEGQFDLGQDEQRQEGYLSRVRVASPAWRFGRMVTRMDWVLRQDPVYAYPLTLGGENGLRGYPSQSFISFGGGRVRGNLEYRSTPVNLSSIRTGVVAFYDAGLLYDGSANTGYLDSAGLGFRMVIPQFSRFAYRLDFGVPLDGSGFMIQISGETNQAVPMTVTEDLLPKEIFSIGGLENQR